MISSPLLTSLPLAGTLSFLMLTFALFTVVSVSSVGSSGFSGFSGSLSIIAVFLITLLYSPSPNLSTVTSKLTAKLDFLSTFTRIPPAKLSLFKSVLFSLFILMLPSTKLVPSGILSFTITSPALSPVLFTVIVYVIFSPSTT